MKLLQLLRPDRWTLGVLAFFLLFPILMALTVPGVIKGYGYGTVDSEGNVVSSHEGSTGPRHQWYYPVLYPFMLIWYAAIIPFELVDNNLSFNLFEYYHSIQFIYYYLISATVAIPIRKLMGHARAKKRWRC